MHKPSSVYELEPSRRRTHTNCSGGNRVPSLVSRLRTTSPWKTMKFRTFREFFSSSKRRARKSAVQLSVTATNAPVTTRVTKRGRSYIEARAIWEQEPSRAITCKTKQHGRWTCVDRGPRYLGRSPNPVPGSRSHFISLQDQEKPYSTADTLSIHSDPSNTQL
jgi:hypothetical protein